MQAREKTNSTAMCDWTNCRTCAPICWMCGARFNAPSTRALTSVEPSTSMLVAPRRARTALLGVLLVHGELLRKLAIDVALAGASMGTSAQHTCNRAKAATKQSTRMAWFVSDDTKASIYNPVSDEGLVTRHHFGELGERLPQPLD
jgi:RES domain-containing protein